MYLNVVVPGLQYERGIVRFFREHRKQPMGDGLNDGGHVARWLPGVDVKLRCKAAAFAKS
jgi:hypothetical protein